MIFTVINGEVVSGNSLDELMTALDELCRRSNIRQVTYFIDRKNWRVHILNGDVIVHNTPIRER